MSGFWAVSPGGNEVHINGDPDMSKETLNALLALMDAATGQYGRQQKVFDQLWEQSSDRILGKMDKDAAFWWFREGCTWQIQERRKTDEQK